MKLECFFCDACGERLGWTLDANYLNSKMFCDECRKEIEEVAS